MSPEEFAKFRHEAVHSLMRLNKSCEHEFRISSWPRWHYDLERGTLSFLNDDQPRVIASIQVVGTTSERSGTWLWSWANESLPENATRSMMKVRAFGEQESLSDLTTPSAADDAYVGWGMTAIAAKIIGAKGGYRCPGENGFLYVAYMDLSFAESVPQGQIACQTHGTGYETFVCDHLMSNPAQLWFSEDVTDEKQWPDAWCAACDAVFQEEGGWNERNETELKIRLICHRCYEFLRSQSVAPK